MSSILKLPTRQVFPERTQKLEALEEVECNVFKVKLFVNKEKLLFLWSFFDILQLYMDFPKSHLYLKVFSFFFFYFHKNMQEKNNKTSGINKDAS